MSGTGPLFSIVTPAYDESKNLPILYRNLAAALSAAPVAWEWVVVDDGSRDDTWGVIAELTRADPRVRGLRLAHNAGAYAAIARGLKDARGSAVAVLAADLQDPPEVLLRLLDIWKTGAEVVWAARCGYLAERPLRRLASRLFWYLLRRSAPHSRLPATGSDCFLVDATVVEALRGAPGIPTNVVAWIARGGFREVSVPYEKGRRLYGRSGWTLWRQLSLFASALRDPLSEAKRQRPGGEPGRD